MSANMLDDRISTQKDLSKKERWDMMNNIFNKDSNKSLYSGLKSQSHKDWS